MPNAATFVEARTFRPCHRLAARAHCPREDRRSGRKVVLENGWWKRFLLGAGNQVVGVSPVIGWSGKPGFLVEAIDVEAIVAEALAKLSCATALTHQGALGSLE